MPVKTTFTVGKDQGLLKWSNMGYSMGNIGEFLTIFILFSGEKLVSRDLKLLFGIS